MNIRVNQINAILYSDKKFVIELLSNRTLTFKKLKEYLGVLFTNDEEQFYKVCSWLKQDVPQFFNLKFNDLYQKSIKKGTVAFYKMKDFGFPLDDETLLLQSLLATASKESFNYNLPFIKEVLMIYEQREVRLGLILKQLEKFVAIEFKSFDYFFIRQTYKDLNPKHTAQKLDLAWIKSKTMVFNHLLSSLLEPDESLNETLLEVINLYLDENGKIEKLTKVAKNSPRLDMLLLYIERKILKEKIDSELFLPLSTQTLKIKN